MGQVVHVRLELYCEDAECRNRPARIFEAPHLFAAIREARRSGWRFKPGLGRIGHKMCICPEHREKRYQSTYFTTVN
jgi:hypothetical protein